jgi:1,4-dihydroxy-2-naphthoyl-CoA synthase
MEMGREMAGKASMALRYCKEAVYKGLDMTLAQGLQLEGDLYFLLHTTEDRTEGITAFKEKRRPKFKGK